MGSAKGQTSDRSLDAATMRERKGLARRGDEDCRNRIVDIVEAAVMGVRTEREIAIAVDDQVCDAAKRKIAGQRPRAKGRQLTPNLVLRGARGAVPGNDATLKPLGTTAARLIVFSLNWIMRRMFSHPIEAHFARIAP